jgi:hypothetical protein
MALNRLFDSGVPLPPPDVQSTTFSVDGLARFTCNTWDEIIAAQGETSFDVIIAGSGMYGAYTASKLFELGRRMADESHAPRVLVLESGPFLITEHIQNLTRRSTPLGGLVAEPLVEPGQTNADSFVTHSRCVGGKSLFWGGWAPRFQPEDLDRLDENGRRLWPQEIKDYLNHSGWPGGYALCETEIGAQPVQDFINGPLYEALKSRAETVITNGDVPALKAVLPPPVAVQGEAPGSGLFSFDKFSSLPLLLDSIREDCELGGADNTARRLFLVPNANVLRLETAGGRVHQVVVALADPAEPRNKARARVVRLNLKSSAMVIVAGNTINSTRLAVNSFPRRADGAQPDVPRPQQLCLAHQAQRPEPAAARPVQDQDGRAAHHRLGAHAGRQHRPVSLSVLRRAQHGRAHVSRRQPRSRAVSLPDAPQHRGCAVRA